MHARPHRCDYGTRFPWGDGPAAHIPLRKPDGTETMTATDATYLDRYPYQIVLNIQDTDPAFRAAEDLLRRESPVAVAGDGPRRYGFRLYAHRDGVLRDLLVRYGPGSA